MTSLTELLIDLAGKDIKVWAEGDKLRCSGPDGFMTADLRSQLSERKAELLEFLSQLKRAEGSAARLSASGSEQTTSESNEPPLITAKPCSESTSSQGSVIDREIESSIAWKGSDLPADAGFVRVPVECASEIRALARELEANPLPLASLRPADFELPACRALMNAVKREIDHGLGFAIIDRLDLGTMMRETAVAVYWLLASMVARPVAQKWDGTMIYEVTDLGKRSTRAVDTNDEMVYHTDNAFNICAPSYVGLLCLQKAKEGGISRIVNFATVYNEMRRRCPGLLRRLYRPFLFDRQREHAPGDVAMVRYPIFENQDGRLVGRLSRFHVKMGHALAGEPLDPEGEDGLETLDAIMNESGMGQSFFFEPGQIQIIDNRRVGHKRTSFIDWPEPDRRRRLTRLWLRDHGRPFYNG